MAGRIVFILLWIGCALHAAGAQPDRRIHFNRDIRPILSENCFHCHGTDENKRKAKLRLDERESAVATMAIVPGKPEASELIARIFTANEEDVMPPAESHRRLTGEQKELLRAWIAAGATYDSHWAFDSPQRPHVPTVRDSRWARNDIDRFILARLETEGLRPQPNAPLEKLLRRLALDLTGLPTDPEKVGRWLKRADPFSAAVDDLLASPHFGERMAQDWLDVARYADTHGFNNDSMRTMWRWRDWVIDAFNQNMPYSRFIQEQLAGDLLEKPTLNQRIATGFNRNHVINSEGGIIDEEYRVEYVADRLQTAATAWLGLTVGCARCHDHKFDPLTQKDYYRMFGFFNNIEEYGEDGRIANASPIMPAPTRDQQARMADLRKTWQEAEAAISSAIKKSQWDKIPLEKFLRPPTNTIAATNLILLLHPDESSLAKGSFTNLAGRYPFKIEGSLAITNHPLIPTNAFILGGSGSLQTSELKNSEKGWAFSAWVRRDGASEGTVFSSARYDVPQSSERYGQGIEIRLTADGTVDVRVARRWPAYSIQVLSRDAIELNEWRHLLVVSDGSTAARGVRVFIDGDETFRDVIHDDLAGAVSLGGAARIGGSDGPGAPRFRGLLADVRVWSRPDREAASAGSRAEALRFAATRVTSGVLLPEADSRQLLSRALLIESDKEVARLTADARAARAALLALEREAPTTMIMQEMQTPRPTFVLFRGQYDQPRDQVETGIPTFLGEWPDKAPLNRLGLATWLTSPRQPLTARVAVNRFWQSLFGTGIVKTAEDFGYQAEFPSHPELLDWLAVDFIESGWDVKRLLRLMVTSATYQQDSCSSPELNERDPENRLLARAPRQRLTGEMLRDQALVLGGLLKSRIGGPPVYPYQPTNLYKGIVVAADYPGTVYNESTGDDLYRRSLYTFWKRTVPHPTLATFDAPDREFCVARRLRTNTPLQALALMNDTIQVEAARKLAERIIVSAAKPEDRLQLAFVLATGRKADSTEMEHLSALLAKRLAYYRSDERGAKAFLSVGTSKVAADMNPAELAAYANITSLILNLDETITRN